MGDLTINNIDNSDTFRNHELVAGWLKCVESFNEPIWSFNGRWHGCLRQKPGGKTRAYDGALCRFPA